MFILKRQDVEISTIEHPKRGQQVPILHYQGQTFRLISIYKASESEEAKALWRELTDNRGKACVLLEEPERYSVWGKIRVDHSIRNADASKANNRIRTVGSILLLQAMYLDIEEFLGAKNAALFGKDMDRVLQQWQFPQTSSSSELSYLLSIDPLESIETPLWSEDYVILFLENLHRLAKAYFGNTNFADRTEYILQDMPPIERSHFIEWLNKSAPGKLWH